MEDLSTSLFLARAFGVYLLIVGVALAAQPERFRIWYGNILKDQSRALFGATVALMIGSFLIASHNVWILDWPLLITLIGYWALFKGACILIYPPSIQGFRPMVDASDLVYRASGLGWILFGAYLAWQGFCGG